jgi:hypothetical protein
MLDANVRRAIGKSLRIYFNALMGETPDRLMELVRKDGAVSGR